MENRFSRKKGSISIFMVIIIPTLIIASVYVFYMLNNRNIKNERFKLLGYSSELQLSEHHEYLLNEYGLLGYYQGEGIGGIYEMLLEENRHPNFKTFEATYSPLSNPDHYTYMCLEASKVLLPIGFAKEMLTFEGKKDTEPDTYDPLPSAEIQGESEGEDEIPEKPEEAITVEERQRELDEALQEKDDGKVQIHEMQWIGTNTYIESLSVIEKIAIKEYFLSVYTSLDLKCPRSLDVFSRNKRAIGVVKGEIEYLIAGKTSDQANQRKVWLTIYGLRQATNTLHIMTSPEKRNMISAFTFAIPPPWNVVVYAGIVALWSGAESYVDMHKLLNGESMFPIKTRSEWHLDLNTALSGSWKSGSKNTNAVGKWYYFDYLRSLLYLQRTETVIKRSMNLLNQDLKKQSKGLIQLENLSIGHVIAVEFEDGIKLKWEAKYP